MPIGLIGSLAICTVFYLLVASGVIGTVGAQPLLDEAGKGISPGDATGMAAACANVANEAVVCSKEALAWTLREIGWQQIGNLVGLAAGLALPSVVLMMMFGQTRIFFVMSRDGLLPEKGLRCYRGGEKFLEGMGRGGFGLPFFGQRQPSLADTSAERSASGRGP
jgi:APA family basic amino acid/polyamine antiporter